MAQYFSSLLSFDPQWGQIVYFFRIIRFWFSFIARSFWNFHKIQVLWEDHEIWKNIPPFFWNYLVKRKQNGRFFFKFLWHSQNTWTLQLHLFVCSCTAPFKSGVRQKGRMFESLCSSEKLFFQSLRWKESMHQEMDKLGTKDERLSTPSQRLPSENQFGMTIA